MMKMATLVVKMCWCLPTYVFDNNDCKIYLLHRIRLSLDVSQPLASTHSSIVVNSLSKYISRINYIKAKV